MLRNWKKSLCLSIVVLVLPIVFAGCQKKVKTGLCTKDADCQVDATGKQINGVCDNGTCQECLQDQDCSDLRQCVNKRCENICSVDADCGLNQHCEGTLCKANCKDSTACAGSEICEEGRCVAGIIGGDVLALTEAECQNVEMVHFAFDKFTVENEYKPNLDKLARCLKDFPGMTVTIKGHADERGTPAYNMVLAEKRANAVSSYLKDKGIASIRVKTVSYGEKEPLVKESNEYAWQQNRRAEFELNN